MFRTARTAWFVTLAAVCMGSLLASTAGAQSPFLSVDFNTNDNAGGGTNPTYSTTQAGFVGFDVPRANTAGASVSQAFVVSSASVPSNSITVTLTPASGAAIGSRLRTQTPANGGAFTTTDLYRDLVFNSAANSSATADSGALTITLTGLKSGASYDVRFYAYDAQNNTATAGVTTSTVQFTNTTGGTQPGPASASYTYTELAAPPSDTAYSAVLTGVAVGTSDTDGVLKFTEVAVAGTNDQRLPVLNGLQVTALPEPASIAAMGTLAVGLLASRRRDSCSRARTRA